jgi:hypothetical protein
MPITILNDIHYGVILKNIETLYEVNPFTNKQSYRQFQEKNSLKIIPQAILVVLEWSVWESSLQCLTI